MKTKLTIQIIILLLCAIILPLQAQNPTYEARLMNDVLISPNSFEFDIYIKRTGTIPFKVYGLQVGLIFNDSIRNGGTLTAVYVPGTSDMNINQIPGNPNVASVVEGKRVFKLPAKIASDSMNATIISALGNGTRLGRFRISTTALTFKEFSPNISWIFSFFPYNYWTKFDAWVGGNYIIYNITNEAYHMNELTYFSASYPPPDYQAILLNDLRTNSTNYEFDIFMKSIGANPFYFNGAIICLLFDNEISGGGEISSYYINGSSQMNSGQIPGSVDVFNIVGGKRVWKLEIPQTLTSYTVISNLNNGSRLGRFSIRTNAPSFASYRANLSWNFDGSYYQYQTKISSLGYLPIWWGGYYSLDITDSSKHLKNLSNPILPVEMISFQATVTNDNKVLLEWSTATETNNYGFDVERKCLAQTISEGDGFNDWEKIGFVSGFGNSSSPKNYTYIDNTLTGGSKFAYRLKQIDHDGTFSLSSIQSIELELKDYVLSQNYPNPFNPSTTIEYIIPEAGQVLLSVYNLLGEKVDEIVNELKESGIYQVDFDANKLSSGTYIYILRSNGNSVSKKMVVLR